MRSLQVSAAILAATCGPMFALSSEFTDDFQAVQTYDSASLLAPCYGGPPTKYTVIELQSGNIFQERADSAGGALGISNNSLNEPFPGIPRHELAVVGWVGLGLGCPGEPGFLQSTESFTDPNLCTYGGYSFNPWQLRMQPGFLSLIGLDFRRGIAGVDDDLDGTTDGSIGIPGIDDDGDGTTDNQLEVVDHDENPAFRAGLGFSGYAPYPAGQDGAPGVAGIDDDGNGSTDDLGETGWPGSDDGDDGPGRLTLSQFMRLDPNTGSGVLLHVDPGSSGNNIFSMRELLFFQDKALEFSDEVGSSQLGANFYQPYSHYNYAFCSSGTCYGALMWQGSNLANPSETLGPVINTHHNSPTASLVAMGAQHLDGAYVREATFRGNQNFSDQFWVIPGDPALFFPSVSTDFDGDRDVDANDFLTFANCFNGSLNPPTGICANLQADVDGDNDVDANDFLTFSNCFNGSLNKPKPICLPASDLGVCITSAECPCPPWPTLTIVTAGAALTNFTTPACPPAAQPAPTIGGGRFKLGAMGGQNVGATEASSQITVKLDGTGVDPACCKKCNVGFIQNILSRKMVADYDGGGKTTYELPAAGDFKPPLVDTSSAAARPWYKVPAPNPVKGKACDTNFDVKMRDRPAMNLPLCKSGQKLTKVTDTAEFITWLVLECPAGSGTYTYAYHWEWKTEHVYELATNNCTTGTLKAGHKACSTTTANGAGKGTKTPVTGGKIPNGYQDFDTVGF